MTTTLACAASTNPEHQQSAAHSRGAPTADKGALRCIRVYSVGERSGPEYHTLEIQRASIERTGWNHGYELVDVLRDQDQSGRSRNRPQFGIAVQRILASEADAIIVSKVGRGAKAPWRNGLHTYPGGVIHCHRWPRRELLLAHAASLRFAAPRSPPATIRFDARDLIPVIDSRTGELDENAERLRHALASLTSANDPDGDARAVRWAGPRIASSPRR